MSSNRPSVPRIQSHYFDWPESTDMLVFPADKHRTYFAIEDDDAHDLHMWVGDNPPADVSQWWSISNEHVFFEHGVFGPIHFTEPGGGGGDLKLISNLIEQPTIEDLPT